MKKYYIIFVSLLMTVIQPNEVNAQDLTSMWCLKTDQGQYIEMARVEMLAAIDGQSTFEVIVREGRGAVRVNDQYRIEFKTSSKGEITICNITKLSNHYK